MNKADHLNQLNTNPIYAIMGEELSLGRKNIEVAQELIANGVKIIQYREKHKTWREKYAEAKVIADLCRANDVTFFMNDSVDLAIACGATGIHVGQDDAPLAIVRQLAGPEVLIGVSTNSVAEIQEAVQSGADYIGFGPMFHTDSKKDANPVVSDEAVAYALQQCPIPVVTIGGISKDNIADLYKKGFRSFAMISAIVSQPDMKKAIKEIENIIAQIA
jgi:thiamine-phosphate pyrophosphorylase